MTGVLFRKLLRDVRVPLVVLVVLLAGFQGLWAKITERITAQLAPLLLWLAAGRGVTAQQVEETIFAGPGRITRTMMGGESISFFRVTDMLSIGYVHPLVQTILCVWAIGRAAGAIAGEIDRGTMELLLAQPLARARVVLAHLCVDLVAIPILCLSMWAGTCLGVWGVGLRELSGPLDGSGTAIDLVAFGRALANAAALAFAVSGLTMCLSAQGRVRGRVMGVAVLLTLLQFLINVVGQLWDAAEVLRPYTVFFYYQPQQIILRNRWTVALAPVWDAGQTVYAVNGVAVLVGVGLVGYGLALWGFTRRDIPAPL